MKEKEFENHKPENKIVQKSSIFDDSNSGSPSGDFVLDEKEIVGSATYYKTDIKEFIRRLKEMIVLTSKNSNQWIRPNTIIAKIDKLAGKKLR